MKLPAKGELAGRAIQEWVGRTADSKIPARVSLRVVLRHNRKDALTGEPLRPGYHIDHITALRDWVATPEAPHGNREGNLQPVNAATNLAKEAKERKSRAKVKRIQAKSIMPRKPSKLLNRGFTKAGPKEREVGPKEAQRRALQEKRMGR